MLRLLLLVHFVCLCGSSSIHRISVTLGNTVAAAGPTNRWPDTPLMTLRANGRIRAYASNAVTSLVYDIQEDEPLPVRTNRDLPAMTKTDENSMPGIGAPYDAFGVWIMAAEPVNANGSVVHAWQHAENDYVDESTSQLIYFKSIGSSISTDAGLTFTSQNQVVSRPPADAFRRQNGDGDGCMVRSFDHKYRFMYFLDSSEYKIRVARSFHTVTGLGPNMWRKWTGVDWTGEPRNSKAQGSLNMPGGNAVRRWIHNNQVDFLVTGTTFAGKRGGVYLGLCKNCSTGLEWDESQIRILHSSVQWERNSTAPEHHVYCALYPPTGGTDLHTNHIDTFLHCLYLPYGADFTERYLVRRNITIRWHEKELDPMIDGPISRAGLFEYYSAESGAYYYATFGLAPSGFVLNKSSPIGFVATDQTRPTDQVLKGCKNGNLVLYARNCQTVTLAELGYVAVSQVAGTVPLYRCKSTSQKGHRLVLDAATECDGSAWTLEFAVGFVWRAAQPTAALAAPPQRAALHTFFSAVRNDFRPSAFLRESPDPRYIYRTLLGYAPTVRTTDADHELVLCYARSTYNHFVNWADSSAPCPNRQALGVYALARGVGGTVPLYKCIDRSGVPKSALVAGDDCTVRGPNYEQQARLGYIYKERLPNSVSSTAASTKAATKTANAPITISRAFTLPRMGQTSGSSSTAAATAKSMSRMSSEDSVSLKTTAAVVTTGTSVHTSAALLGLLVSIHCFQ